MGEDISRQSMGELRADVAAARSDERREKVADDLAHRRLERGDLLRLEVGVQRAPVRRVLRRVEMQGGRRPVNATFGTTFCTVVVKSAGSPATATTSS